MRRVLPERAGYLTTSLATTAAGGLERHRAHAVTKTAMVPALQGSVLRRWSVLTGESRTALIGSTTAALVGDVLLVPPAAGEPNDAARRRLQRGAMAFAVQQIGYLGILRRLGARPRWRTALPVAGPSLRARSPRHGEGVGP